MTGIWERFEHDPREASYAGLRAADRDRAVLHEVLGEAYADGRLSREEFDERSQHVIEARTLGELPALVADLIPSTAVAARAPGPRTPDARRAEAEQRYRSERSQALVTFLVPTLICWTIWISVWFNGHGNPFPWPVFVMVGTGIGLARLVSDKEGNIAAIERRLLRKEQKEIERREQRALEARRREGDGPGEAGEPD